MTRRGILLVLMAMLLVPGLRARLLIARSRTVGQFGDGASDFRYPIGLALVDEDSFYVSDWKANRVSLFNREGKLLRPLFPEGPDFDGPLGLARDELGFLYVVENRASRIRKFDASGRQVAILGRRGHDPGEFYRPRGIAVGLQGQLYVADYGNRRVQVLDAEGGFLQELVFLDPESDRDARPRGVAVDPAGRVWASYTQSNQIVRFSTQGVPELVFGRKGKGRGSFDGPRYMAFDVRGNLYVSDYENHRIQKFSPEGEFLYSFGARGSAPGQFHNPEAVAVNVRGDLFIADTVNYRVQVLELNGVDAARNLGFQAFRDQLWDQAIEHYNRVLKREPGEHEALAKLEEIHLTRARQAREAGRLERSMEIYNRLLRLIPGHLEAHRAIRELFWERSRPLAHSLALGAGMLVSGLLFLLLLVRALREEWRREPGNRPPPEGVRDLSDEELVFGAGDARLRDYAAPASPPEPS